MGTAVSLLPPSSQHRCCPDSCLGLFLSGVTGSCHLPITDTQTAAPRPVSQAVLLCSAEPGLGAPSLTCALLPHKACLVQHRTVSEWVHYLCLEHARAQT